MQLKYSFHLFSFFFQRWDENDQNVMEPSLNKHGREQQKDSGVGIPLVVSAEEESGQSHPPIQDMTKVSLPKHSPQSLSQTGTNSKDCHPAPSSDGLACITGSDRCSDLTAGQYHCQCNNSGEVTVINPSVKTPCRVHPDSIPSSSSENKSIEKDNSRRHSRCNCSQSSSSSTHSENIPNKYSACKEARAICARPKIPQIVLQRVSSCDDSYSDSSVVDALYSADVELFKNAKILSDHRFKGKDDSFVKPSLKVDIDLASHLPLSPRSSNGSICSARSSNADSAVDILTPDEELYSVGDVQIPPDSVDWFSSHIDLSHKDPTTSTSLAESVFSIPAVVISDHSEPHREGPEESYCPDSGTECRLTLRRNASSSSLCSDDSSLSSSPALSRTESNLSLTETDEEIPEIKPKVSVNFFMVFFKNIISFSANKVWGMQLNHLVRLSVCPNLS